MKECARVFDGWLTPYKKNRLLWESEIISHLSREVVIETLPPVDKGLLRVNGVFAEYADRYFHLRGWAAMGGVPIACVFLWFTLFFCFDLYVFSNIRTESQIVAAWVAVSVLGGFTIAVFYFTLLKEFFCYTHYPIRFNRVSRKVYVFRHNGKGGVVDLDWDGVYWFVGRSRDGSDISYDLRCHVLDAEGIVRDTFAVGHFASTRAEILQHWEMIRRYMEGSPADLPFPPLALVLSTKPTWRNCITIQVGGASGHSPVFMLLTLPWAFFRWISQITCRRPRWPDEVEAECQIPIDDPYRLPEPVSSGEVIGLDEVSEAALFEYREKAEAAALAYEAAYSK
ncbi:DUF6708 domain-containing protein [Pseudomonas lundensis]|uniref:DUF6708 domain-containing protein n=1 Tax=Pseudomonas lundensis TaxID=86185 RepID=UPI0039081D62